MGGIKKWVAVAGVVAVGILAARAIGGAAPVPARGVAARSARVMHLLPAAVAAACPEITPALKAQGKKIFEGQGNCFTCHGGDAHGTALAPNLTDKTWLNISGSYESIEGLVTAGVPHPKEHPAPMPPKGGADLNASQVCAVAAYVYSLSH